MILYYEHRRGKGRGDTSICRPLGLDERGLCPGNFKSCDLTAEVCVSCRSTEEALIKLGHMPPEVWDSYQYAKFRPILRTLWTGLKFART